MSDCPEWEDLLTEDSGDHAAHCPKCRDLLESLARVDATFESAFAGVCAPRELEVAVISRISGIQREGRVTMLPEILDFIAWAAALAAAAVAVPYFASILTSFMAGIGLGG